MDAHLMQAAKTLVPPFSPWDAGDAAQNVIRTAAKARIAGYYDEIENDSDMELTGRTIILTRIDTLMKFAGLTEDDLKD